VPASSFVDYYECMQLSPNADQETIERVYRLLAKRYHPDNPHTGDPDKFSRLTTAFRVLSNPEQRAAYDAGYEESRAAQWKLFIQADPGGGVDSDQLIRHSILSLLYTARRNNASKAGVGILHLEDLLSCPQHLMEFHIWYMKSKGWIVRTDTGELAITAEGVDEYTSGERHFVKDRLLPPGRQGREEAES